MPAGPPEGLAASNSDRPFHPYDSPNRYKHHR